VDLVINDYNKKGKLKIFYCLIIILYIKNCAQRDCEWGRKMSQSNRIKNREWWQRPGFGIMYQIEARPGWIWNRNFDKFNASMMDENGNLQFNGPFCKMKKWVEFSKKVGVDYHIFEAKWHDGICYWDTKLTDYKTPEDYCKIFTEESKKYNIPCMYYYSSIFDHNRS